MSGNFSEKFQIFRMMFGGCLITPKFSMQESWWPQLHSGDVTQILMSAQL